MLGQQKKKVKKKEKNDMMPLKTGQGTQYPYCRQRAYATT
jgi:hypothetical protein